MITSVHGETLSVGFCSSYNAFCHKTVGKEVMAYEMKILPYVIAKQAGAISSAPVHRIAYLRSQWRCVDDFTQLIFIFKGGLLCLRN